MTLFSKMHHTYPQTEQHAPPETKKEKKKKKKGGHKLAIQLVDVHIEDVLLSASCPVQVCVCVCVYVLCVCVCLYVHVFLN
jgi:lipopolysaccharide/colanic/teichoic acid biosynthesis glycosyltransferase